MSTCAGLGSNAGGQAYSQPTSFANRAYLSNPFLQETAEPAPLAASTVNLINFRAHVPITLDMAEANYSAWCTFFELTLRKLGLLDHVNGTIDAPLKRHDADWTQIDNCVVS